MAATTTLTSTTFASPVAESDFTINLASTSGITPGVFLFSARELMVVERFTGVGNMAVVRRAVEGTPNRKHATNETVWIGRGDQFYHQDPVGTPPLQPRVSPHINVLTGVAWIVQGDDAGPGKEAQTWQPMTSAQTIGPLGVRVDTVTTPS